MPTTFAASFLLSLPEGLRAYEDEVEDEEKQSGDASHESSTADGDEGKLRSIGGAGGIVGGYVIMGNPMHGEGHIHGEGIGIGTKRV
jgi:hypothetical protein